MNLSPLTDKILQYYTNAGLTAQVVILLIVTFTVSSIILGIVILINRIKRSYVERKLNRFREQFLDFLADWAYNTEEEKSVPSSIIQSLRNKSKRELFTNEILSLHANLYGDSSRKLENLFRKTGLVKHSLKKANSGKWDIKARGITEIVKMNISEGKGIIKNNLDSGNPFIASIAQNAWIEINDEQTDTFLNIPGVTLSDWWQISAINSYKKKEIIPDFGKWIDHENVNVSRFAIRMCGIFKQYNNLDKIISEIDSQDSSVRVEAINAAGLFAMPDALEKLEMRYHLEENPVKRRIIKAMTYICDCQSLAFYNEVMATEKDPIIRIMTAKAIIKLGAEGEELLDYITLKADDTMLSIIRHAKDKMI